MKRKITIWAISSILLWSSFCAHGKTFSLEKSAQLKASSELSINLFEPTIGSDDFGLSHHIDGTRHVISWNFAFVAQRNIVQYFSYLHKPVKVYLLLRVLRN
jgi:hypothetical protein